MEKSSSSEDIVYLTGDTHGQFDRISLFCHKEKATVGQNAHYSRRRGS